MIAGLSAAEFERCMGDPVWRINNLYKIIIKGDDEEDGLVIDFKMNPAQQRFVEALHYRNIILKARQIGFTTLIAIIWLDHALFNPNSRCGIIAQDREQAKIIFRDKVKFAYQNLPEELREAMPIAVDNADELLFAHNNSSIRVATSMRSGTIHRLHISEFGKICAKFPDKAKEVITGSIPAVPINGIVIIESTAEGREGKFYDMTQRAIAINETGNPLTQKDYRFHFYPWHGEPKYSMSSVGVVITSKDHEYFDAKEAECGCAITLEQRAWYVATRESDFAGEQQLMQQEYPSTPAEAFEASVTGCYYTNQLTAIRKTGRILNIPIERMPVSTFWDLGSGDGCAIWFYQRVGMEDRFIDYYEAHGEDLTHYNIVLQQRGYLYAKHYLPHDAAHRRLGERNKSIQDQFHGMGLQNTVIVPVTPSINAAIQLTRQAMATCYFDAVRCKDGIDRLAGYKKRWNEAAGRWSDEPLHDANSEGADAFRQFAQAKAGNLITINGREVRPQIQSFAPIDPGFGY